MTRAEYLQCVGCISPAADVTQSRKETIAERQLFTDSLSIDGARFVRSEPSRCFWHVTTETMCDSNGRENKRDSTSHRIYNAINGNGAVFPKKQKLTGKLLTQRRRYHAISRCSDSADSIWQQRQQLVAGCFYFTDFARWRFDFIDWTADRSADRRGIRKPAAIPVGEGGRATRVGKSTSDSRSTTV